MSNLSFPLKVHEGADALKKRYLVVYPVELVQPDLVGAQCTKAGLTVLS
jgi:hypothetical protein